VYPYTVFFPVAFVACAFHFFTTSAPFNRGSSKPSDLFVGTVVWLFGGLVCCVGFLLAFFFFFVVVGLFFFLSGGVFYQAFIEPLAPKYPRSPQIILVDMRFPLKLTLLNESPLPSPWSTSPWYFLYRSLLKDRLFPPRNISLFLPR